MPRKKSARKPIPGLRDERPTGQARQDGARLPRAGSRASVVEQGRVAPRAGQIRRRTARARSRSAKVCSNGSTPSSAPTANVRTADAPADVGALSARGVHALRPRTRDNYLKRWGKFERFKGRDYLAAKVTRETLDDFRAELRKLEHEVNQIQRHVQMVKSVFKWAVDRDLIPPTKVTTYRFKRARDERSWSFPSTRRTRHGDPRAVRSARPARLARLRRDVSLRVRRPAAKRRAPSDLVRRRPSRERSNGAGARQAREGAHAAGAGARVEALWVAYGWRWRSDYVGPYVHFPARRRAIRGNGQWAVRDGAPSARAAAKPDQPWTYSAYNAGSGAPEISAGCRTSTIAPRTASGDSC
jgi:hypothetical protein